MDALFPLVSLSFTTFLYTFFFLSFSLSLSLSHTHILTYTIVSSSTADNHIHTQVRQSLFLNSLRRTHSYVTRYSFKRSNLLLIHLSLTDIIGSLFRPLIFLHLHQIISFCFCFLNCSFIFNCCEHLLKHTHESSYSHTLRLPPYTIFLSLTHKHTLSHWRSHLCTRIPSYSLSHRCT